MQSIKMIFSGVTILQGIDFTIFLLIFAWALCMYSATALPVMEVTRNSSGDEITNVNFLYGDIVHALQNTINSCINSATDRPGYVLERRFTKVSEITQCNGHYAVQGRSRSPILVPTESSIISRMLAITYIKTRFEIYSGQ